MNEIIQKVCAAIILMFAACVMSLVGCYLLIDIAELYNLTEITRLSFMQVYGFLTIIAIVRYREKDSSDKDDQSFSEYVKDNIKQILKRVYTFAVWYGLAVMMYHLIAGR